MKRLLDQDTVLIENEREQEISCIDDSYSNLGLKTPGSGSRKR